jgi:DNA-binding MarR family transcriptional regulator
MKPESLPRPVADPDVLLAPGLSSPYRLGYQLRRADRALGLASAERLRPIGLNPAQVTILLFINRFPEITMARLSNLATVTPQTMHRAVTTLLERQLVQRIDKPDDRKSFGLVLTPPGEKLLAEGEAAVRATQDIAIAAFSREELEQLYGLLQRYEAALQKPRAEGE